MPHRPARTFIAFACLAAAASASIAGTGGVTANTGHNLPPVTAASTPSTSSLSNFGLCDQPQNPDAHASSPVPVETLGVCYEKQQYVAASNGPSTPSSSCGGWKMAFGPSGQLMTNQNHVLLTAEYAGPAIASAAACQQAKIAAAAWGAHCTNASCSEAQYEKIVLQKQRSGQWNASSGTCELKLEFSRGARRYKTLALDIISTRVVNGSPVRQRVRGTILASRPTVQCASASAPRR